MDTLYIGNTGKGLTKNPLPFNIDNEAFPTMYNFYSWRGRAKRKRGTVFLGQMQRQIQSAVSPNQWQYPIIATLNGSGATTAPVDLQELFGLEPYATIAPGTINFSDGTNTYTEQLVNGLFTGNLVGSPSGTGTINYATTAITIAGGAANQPLIGTFGYFPTLPALGLEDYITEESVTPYPMTIGFDQRYAYQIKQTTSAVNFFSVSYFKSSNNPVYWTGNDYQQFWSTNNLGAFWATNNNPGMQYKVIASWTNGTNTITINNHNLVVGDVIWVNQATVVTSVNGTCFKVASVTDQNNIVVTSGFGGANPTGGIAQYLTNIAYKTIKTITNISNATDAQVTVTAHGLNMGQAIEFQYVAGMTQINGLTGIVQSIIDANNFTVNINSTNFTAYSSGGIAIYLNSGMGDGIRWYDGDPTQNTGLPQVATSGWVNFAPPLTATAVDIHNLPEALYDLVGALAIVGFKNRLLFFSPWVQSVASDCTAGPIINLPDSVICSVDGTAYYTPFFTASLGFFTPLVTTSVNYVANTKAYYTDQYGLGYFTYYNTGQAIVTVNNNEDVLLVGFVNKQTQFVATGNDVDPFDFYNINSELGSSSTFSSVSLDKGGISVGTYGIAFTDQQSSQRLDLAIPDEVFQINANANGALRVNGIRDYYKEWIYFAYPPNSSPWNFPTQTFFYNYRENNWAIFYENFTTHGSYRKQTGYTWDTIGTAFPTWDSWNESWDSATTSAQFPSIIGGNPQGYVLIKGEGTGEGVSGTVFAVDDSTITSHNHCVQEGDYLYFMNAIGLNNLNGNIYRVVYTADANTFTIDGIITGTYLGLGQYARLSQPLLQTKQFNFYWDQGRQMRLQRQMYLFDTTSDAQVTVNIYLSQDPETPWNAGPIIPSDENPTINSSLIYSQLVYTCPESTNLGLTPANVNLQMPTAVSQKQIWHRMNTSLIGESVQLGVTLNDAQMRNYDYATAEITLHAIEINFSPGPLLA